MLNEYQVRDAPLVSVVIPCFNQADYIEECIASVLNQSYQNIEIICVDDGSNDSSSERINKYTELTNFKFIRNSRNLGVCVSRNNAIREASGIYILPLDGDRVLGVLCHPCKQEAKACIYLSLSLISVRLILIVINYLFILKFLISRIKLLITLILLSNLRFLKAGGYKPYMVYGLEDYELWISFIELGLKPYRIDKILFNYRKTNQISRTEKLLNSARFQRDMKKEIIAHHLPLYLSNESFVKYMTEFSPKYIENLLNENQRKTKKTDKYKKLLIVSYFIFACILSVIFFTVSCNC